jgi:hypothetical protein
MRISALFLALPALVMGEQSTAHHHLHEHEYAPIAVMGGHTHHAGEWMVSYRYMLMEMDGNRSGTNDQSVQEVRARGFAVIPTDMTMEMHMFGVMHAPTDKLTLMGMLPYTIISMNHVAGPTFNVNFETEAEGVGDFKLSSLYTLKKFHNQQFHLNAGLSFPTGSINKKDVTPASNNVPVQLPYPMQLGSGTYDLLPGITYLGQAENCSWGAQAMGVIRLDDNSRNYSLSDKYTVTGWGAWKANNWLSTSLRLVWSTWGNIDGADAALNPNLVPTADPNRRGGDRLDVAVGFNLKVGGHRIALEASLPVHQDLDGPQLETDYTLTVGWQYAW